MARRHYEAGRYEAALGEFFLEQRVAPNPRIVFNIARCHERLRRHAGAYMYYAEYLASTDSDETRRTRASEALTQLESQVARLRVRSEPAGASIYIERRELGVWGVSPSIIARDPGSAHVYIELAGHYPEERDVELTRGALTELALTLRRIVGTVEVSGPADGQVRVLTPAGETVAEGAAPLSAQLAPGDYRVEVSSETHQPWADLIRVEREASTTVSATPEALPPATGALTITANLAGAVVTLDGEAVGFTPTILPGVAVGSHHLELTREGRRPWSGDVAVRPDERAWVTVALAQPQRQTRSDLSYASGALGLALMLGAAITTGFSFAQRDEFDRLTAMGSPGEEAASTGRVLNSVADILWGAGGAFAAVGVVLFFATEGTIELASEASVARGAL